MEFLIEKCASGSCVNDVDVPKFVSHGKNFKLDYTISRHCIGYAPLIPWRVPTNTLVLHLTVS